LTHCIFLDLHRPFSLCGIWFFPFTSTVEARVFRTRDKTPPPGLSFFLVSVFFSVFVFFSLPLSFHWRITLPKRGLFPTFFSCSFQAPSPLWEMTCLVRRSFFWLFFFFSPQPALPGFLIFVFPLPSCHPTQVFCPVRLFFCFFCPFLKVPRRFFPPLRGTSEVLISSVRIVFFVSLLPGRGFFCGRRTRV